jgi:hypothetical protein
MPASQQHDFEWNAGVSILIPQALWLVSVVTSITLT